MQKTAWTSNHSSNEIRPAKMRRTSSSEDDSSTSCSSESNTLEQDITPTKIHSLLGHNLMDSSSSFLTYVQYFNSLPSGDSLCIDDVDTETENPTYYYPEERFAPCTYNSPREQEMAEATRYALTALESQCSQRQSHTDNDNLWEPTSYNQFRPAAITTQPGIHNEWDEGSLYSGAETSSSYTEYDLNPAGKNPAEEMFTMDDM